MSNDLEIESVTTPAEFQTAISELLTAAQQNGISPRGSWVYRNGEGSLTNWEVEIYELQ